MCLQSVRWLLEESIQVFAVSQIAVRRRYARVFSLPDGC